MEIIEFIFFQKILSIVEWRMANFLAQSDRSAGQETSEIEASVARNHDRPIRVAAPFELRSLDVHGIYSHSPSSGAGFLQSAHVTRDRPGIFETT
jgi:hypothetical protein